MAELEQYAEPKYRCWNGENGHWYITYIVKNEEIKIICAIAYYRKHNDIYFESEKKVREAIKAVGWERIKKYYLEVEE
jgi:hypothetical protein